MFLAINIPHVLYILLAFIQPDSFLVVNCFVALEQFGYGFGFSAYMMYMLYIADGEYKTAHYAIATGFMALSMMLPGLVSGYIQQFLGYKLFFIWIFITMIPGYFIVRRLPIDADFGKKKPGNN
jgi:PAT family beta-lactamase induction signal transducer AmpG